MVRVSPSVLNTLCRKILRTLAKNCFPKKLKRIPMRGAQGVKESELLMIEGKEKRVEGGYDDGKGN